MVNLNSSKLYNDRELIVGKLTDARMKKAMLSWIARWYIVLYCFGSFVIILTMTIIVGGTLSTLMGQLLLSLSTYGALFLLSNRPLINPIQAVVLLFHWWFAIGPAFISFFSWLQGNETISKEILSTGSSGLWIVVFGLPLYSISSNAILNSWPHSKWYFRFLMPENHVYKEKTIICYGLVGIITWGTLYLLGAMGFQGVREVNYLGGTVTEIWWIAVISSAGNVSSFALGSIFAYLVGPSGLENKKIKVVAITFIIISVVGAFTSGWKGAMVVVFVLLFLTALTWRQRIPLMLMLSLGVFYFLFVEPFVSYARIQAEIRNVATSQERIELFGEILSEGAYQTNKIFEEINFSSPFRGIYVYANRISERSELIYGPWNGSTFSDGLAALVPRVLLPDKPDMNIGNFFARDLEVSAADNYINNIGVSLPFEFVGNYGYIAGVLSFALIGILWSIFNVVVLSVPRLATHPLSPLIVVFATGMEASLGQFLARFRDFPLVLMTAYVLWRILKKRI